MSECSSTISSSDDEDNKKEKEDEERTDSPQSNVSESILDEDEDESGKKKSYSTSPANPADARTALTTNRPSFGRSRSIGGEDGDSDAGSALLTPGTFTRGDTDRHSYRAPTASSRYLQAAEEYAAR